MATRETDATLNELERVLEDERVALRTLDVPAIERTTNDKSRLEAQIAALAATGSFEARHKAQVQRVRETAAQNQLLLAHARSMVRAGLALATGAEPVGYTNSASQPPPSNGGAPLRVNVRG